jgi:hypothetical protein
VWRVQLCGTVALQTPVLIASVVCKHGGDELSL